MLCLMELEAKRNQEDEGIGSKGWLGALHDTLFTLCATADGWELNSRTRGKKERKGDLKASRVQRKAVERQNTVI